MTEVKVKQNTHLKWILPLLIIGAAIAVFAFLMMNKPQAPSRPTTEKIWSISTVPAAFGLHQPVLTLYGKVESPRVSKITAAVTAFVKDVYTDEGRAINPNELLVQLDDSDTQLLVQQRQADVDNTIAQIETEKVRHKTDLKSLKIEKNLQQLRLKTVQRYENLIKRKLTSQEQLDSARRDYQQQALSIAQREQSIADHPNRLRQLESQLMRTTSLLDAAKLDLSRTKIHAPFSGRVASLSVSPGDRVRAGDPIVELYSLDRLEVRAQIPNRILPLLRNKNSLQEIAATGTIDNRTIELNLERIAAAVNSGRAGVDVFFSIQKQDYQPELGRSLAISVTLPATTKVIPVPPTALYGLNKVYKVVDDRLVSVQIERIGDSTDADNNPIVLITSPDLQAGDSIVTTQLPNAITGLRVKEFTSPETKGLKDE